MIDGFSASWRFNLENLVRSDNTVATDQIIRYPPVADASKYTFSLLAFPEAIYPAVLPAVLASSARSITRPPDTASTCCAWDTASRKDRNSLLSYSWDGDVMTIDPVSTANPGWNAFLDAYNQFCSDHGGIPLLNQTLGVTRAQAQKALGDRLKQFAAARKTYDPHRPPAERLLPRLIGRSRFGRQSLEIKRRSMLSTPWEQRKSAYDFVIIGSGYGGAITAARLATADLESEALRLHSGAGQGVGARNVSGDAVPDVIGGDAQRRAIRWGFTNC